MIKLTALVSFSTLLGKSLSLPASIVTAKVLGASLLGVLAILRLVVYYAGFTHLGLMQSLSRGMSIAHGRGDKRGARKIADAAYSGCVIASAIGLTSGWVLYAFGLFDERVRVRTLVLLTFVILSSYCVNFLRAFSKGEGELLLIGKADLLLKIALPSLTVAGVVFWGVDGVLAAMLISGVVTFAFYVRRLKLAPFRFHFDTTTIVPLVTSGLVLFVTKTSDAISWNVDLLFLAAMTSTSDVGLYSLALATMQMAPAFAGGLGMVAYREIMQAGGRYGAGERHLFRRHTEKSFVSYLMLNSLVLGLAVLAYMYVVDIYLVEYRDSIAVMIILSSGYMIYTARLIPTFYFSATNQLHKRLAISLAGLGINAVLDYYLLRQGYGIRGVAVACCVGFVVMAVAAVMVSWKQIYGSYMNAVWLLARLTLVVAGLTAMLVIFERWDAVGFPGASSWASRALYGLADLLVKSLVFVVVCCAAYLAAFKGYRLDRQLREIVRYVLGMPNGKRSEASDEST